MEKNPARKKLRVFIPLGIVVLLILTGAFLWYRDYSLYITTDDALVDADNVTVSSKMLGRIVAIYADEGDTVRKGELLAELDSSDLLAQKNQAIALRNQALSNIRQAETKYASDQQGLRVVEINLEKAKDDNDRAQKQSQGGVITQEQFDHIRKAYEAASAQVDASKAMLSVSKAQVASAEAAAESANAQIKVLETQLRNARLYSPEDGIVARRWLLPGDIIQAGQSVFTLINDREEWVLVYLEETKISDIFEGQHASFTIDAFRHVKFFGKVYLRGSSTASVFSLIPPNNASGNFTKVTQRIPLRISIDSADTGKKISAYDILSGMSAVVKIRRK
jgi:membrane fusion protein, multidrug efflux system